MEYIYFNLQLGERFVCHRIKHNGFYNISNAQTDFNRIILHNYKYIYWTTTHFLIAIILYYLLRI